MTDKIINNLSAEESELNLRIFNLVLGRAFKRIYSCLDKTGRQNMERVFIAGNDVEKEKIIKELSPDFRNIFEEESKKIKEEINEEIKNSL